MPTLSEFTTALRDITLGDIIGCLSVFMLIPLTLFWGVV